MTFRLANCIIIDAALICGMLSSSISINRRGQNVVLVGSPAIVNNIAYKW